MVDTDAAFTPRLLVLKTPSVEEVGNCDYAVTLSIHN